MLLPHIMKTYWYISVGVLFLICFFSSCKKEEEKPDEKEYPEFIIFGSMQNCIGTGCVRLLKMEPGKLARADNEIGPTGMSPYNGNYSIALSNDKYLQVEPIFKGKIPQELLDMPSGVIGDASHTDFWYFEYKTQIAYKYWMIDTQAVPSALAPFINNISLAFNTALSP